MKNLLQFLTEAGTSQASAQAKKLNLKSDGHGSWFDSRGKLVAVTDKGSLKFTNKKPGAAQDEGPVKQMATARADDKLAGAVAQLLLWCGSQLTIIKHGTLSGDRFVYLCQTENIKKIVDVFSK